MCPTNPGNVLVLSPRDALECNARSCDRMSSGCPPVCDVGGSGPHRLQISETNCANNIAQRLRSS